jgi:nicotinamidase-related amidase
MKKNAILFLLPLFLLGARPKAQVSLNGGSSLNKTSREYKQLTFSLRTKDPQTNREIFRQEKVDSRKVAVVVIDPWDFHWCMTAAERVVAMIPRWNRALECARQMGMTIIWDPSDVAGTYAGYPQREKLLGQKLIPVPDVQEMPPVKFTAPGGMCMCGPGIECIVDYGWDGMAPDLKMAETDFITSSTEEVYTLLKNRGIDHIIYMGLHTNVCLFGKPGALKFMVQAGLNCMLARDINDAITIYDPAKGYTPDTGTQQTDDDLERAGVPTINVVDEWRKTGVWNDQWMVETVRITPWGKRLRPYFFEKEVTVSLTSRLLRDFQIHYTTDGSEPNPGSPVYHKPLVFTRTTDLKTAAFRNGRKVSLPTSAYFVVLPPVPPKPDIYLDELRDVPDPYSLLGPEYAAFLFMPEVGKSYEKKPLQIRDKGYQKGLGFMAPGGIHYELRPGYDRFVGLAGIADNMVKEDMGRNKAMHCSVVFRVFVDGVMLAESPVMRISQEPWRFDVKIPSGGRSLRIACMDAGSRSPYDLGNLVDAGFIQKK